MPERLDFRWGGERGRKRGQFESARTKFPQAFFFLLGAVTVTKSRISLKGGGKEKSRRAWTTLQGRSTTGAATQPLLSPSPSLQAVARAERSHGGGRIPPNQQQADRGRAAPLPQGRHRRPGRQPSRRTLGGLGKQAERPGPDSSRAPTREGHRDGAVTRAVEASARPIPRAPADPGPRKPALPPPPHTHPAEPSGGPPVSLPPPHTHTHHQAPHACGPRDPPPSPPDTARPRRTGARGRCDTSPQRPAAAAPPRPRPAASHWPRRLGPLAGEAEPPSLPCQSPPTARPPPGPRLPARGSGLFPPPSPPPCRTRSRHWVAVLPLRPGGDADWPEVGKG